MNHLNEERVMYVIIDLKMGCVTLFCVCWKSCRNAWDCVYTSYNVRKPVGANILL